MTLMLNENSMHCPQNNHCQGSATWEGIAEAGRKANVSACFDKMLKLHVPVVRID